MNITPLTTYGVQTASGQAIAPQTSRISTGQATFLDVFSRVMSDAIETNQIKDQDMVKLMLGETDHLEQMALNMVKAEIATDLLINVRNNVLDAYNDIIRMQI